MCCHNCDPVSMKLGSRRLQICSSCLNLCVMLEFRPVQRNVQRLLSPVELEPENKGCPRAAGGDLADLYANRPASANVSRGPRG